MIVAFLCRTSNRDLFGGDDEPTEPMMSDEEMFELANTSGDGSGQMTLAEFAAYMGGSEDDADVVTKFDS
jgi:hypothetical protein